MPCGATRPTRRTPRRSSDPKAFVKLVVTLWRTGRLMGGTESRRDERLRPQSGRLAKKKAALAALANN